MLSGCCEEHNLNNLAWLLMLPSSVLRFKFVGEEEEEKARRHGFVLGEAAQIGVPHFYLVLLPAVLKVHFQVCAPTPTRCVASSFKPEIVPQYRLPKKTFKITDLCSQLQPLKSVGNMPAKGRLGTPGLPQHGSSCACICVVRMCLCLLISVRLCPFVSLPHDALS